MTTPVADRATALAPAENGSSSSDLELLAPQFCHEDSGDFGTPSGNYYWYRKRSEIVRLLRRHFRSVARPDMTVIDLGCGSGTDLFLIRRALGVSGRFIGIEASPTALRTCELRASYHEAADVSFIKHDLTMDLPLRDEQIDLVYCSEVVEHLPDPDSLFAEVARILRPGGHLLLTTPNEPNILQRSYLSGRRRAMVRRRTAAEREETKKAAARTVATPLYGHISLRTAKAWDQAVSRYDLELVDFGRGALVYGSSPRLDREPVLGGIFLVQAVLDVLPRSLIRGVSDQVIALYRRLER